MGKPRRAHFQMLRSFTWADLFTFGNVSCGTVSLFLCLYYLTEGQRGFLWAIFGLLPLAAVFDGLDGYVARRWGERSTLGTELDSLADIISFGVAPAVLGFSLGLRGFWDVVVLTYYVGCGISRLGRAPPADAHLCAQWHGHGQQYVTGPKTLMGEVTVQSFWPRDAASPAACIRPRRRPL
jgi:CDP-diacylglycerol---serine O-phosphatidyltransferase